MVEYRIFKIVLPDGGTGFEFQKCNDVSRGFASIASLAKMMRNILDEKGEGMAFLFRPYYDMECPPSLTPRRCLPLTNNEIDEFWRKFNE